MESVFPYIHVASRPKALISQVLQSVLFPWIGKKNSSHFNVNFHQNIFLEQDWMTRKGQNWASWIPVNLSITSWVKTGHSLMISNIPWYDLIDTCNTHCKKAQRSFHLTHWRLCHLKPRVRKTPPFPCAARNPPKKNSWGQLPWQFCICKPYHNSAFGCKFLRWINYLSIYLPTYPPWRLFGSPIVLLFLRTYKPIRINLLSIFLEDFTGPRKRVFLLKIMRS